MSILSAQSIRRLCHRERMINPFCERTEWDPNPLPFRLTHGLGPAGYDIRCTEAAWLDGGGFRCASSVEHFSMPANVLGIVTDKSTWARRGLAVQNTVIEPGWRGYLTLELSNNAKESIIVPEGAPIAQVVFHWLDDYTQHPYAGKYQDQKPGPQEAR